jgi:hypothetical protein
MRDLRGERSRRAGVREERLRAAAGLRQAALPLSAWRGRSGRRYIVGVHSLDARETLEITDAVILAIRRDQEGVAHVIDVATAGSRPVEQARARWMAAVREQGATEMHVHRLAEDDEERRAIVADLCEDEPQDG